MPERQITFDELYIFLEFSRSEHLGRCAEALGLSVSSVQRAVQPKIVVEATDDRRLRPGRHRRDGIGHHPRPQPTERRPTSMRRAAAPDRVDAHQTRGRAGAMRNRVSPPLASFVEVAVTEKQPGGFLASLAGDRLEKRHASIPVDLHPARPAVHPPPTRAARTGVAATAGARGAAAGTAPPAHPGVSGPVRRPRGDRDR